MKIGAWLKIYRFINKKLRYSLFKDLFYPYLILIRFLPKLILSSKLKKIIQNKDIIVFGAGPSLNVFLGNVKFKSKVNLLEKKFVLIASDAAVKPLIENKIIPDIIVSDLDGDIFSIFLAHYKKSQLIIHSHGDNLFECLNYCKFFKNFILTSQMLAFPPLYNFGGFTDGDRAVYIATKYRPKKIYLVGMDFGKITDIYPKSKRQDTGIKKIKLSIGKILLKLLEPEDIDLYIINSEGLGNFKELDENVLI